MKSHLILLVLVSSTAFGQNRSGFPYCALKLRTMTYFQLVREVELIIQEEKIDSLQAELEQAKRNGEVVKGTIDRLHEQNEELRKLMQEYVNQINELNNKNVKLSMGLDQEKDPRVVEQLQKIEKLGAKLEEERRLGAISPEEMRVLEEEYRELELELKELVKEVEGEKR